MVLLDYGSLSRKFAPVATIIISIISSNIVLASTLLLLHKQITPRPTLRNKIIAFQRLFRSYYNSCPTLLCSLQSSSTNFSLKRCYSEHIFKKNRREFPLLQVGDESPALDISRQVCNIVSIFSVLKF